MLTSCGPTGLAIKAAELAIQGVGQSLPFPKITIFKEKTDTQICVYSTSDSGKNWETNPSFKSKVQEAKRKGLTLKDCVRLLVRTNEKAVIAKNYPTPRQTKIV